MKRPAMPPASAVTRLISMLVLYASIYGWWKSSWTFAIVQPDSLPSNAPRRIEPAGRNRNAIVYAKKGTVATHAQEKRLRPDAASGRRPSDTASAAMALAYLRRPVAGDLLARLRLLADARELRLRIERRRRERVQQRLRQDLALGQVVEPGRVREALQVEDLSLVGVDELLPEPRCVRMGRSHVDRLRVVAAVDAVGRDRDRPPRRRELLDVREVVVVPVDRDRRLARSDRLRRRPDRDEIACLLQLSEEVDAGADVVQRPAVCE